MILWPCVGVYTFEEGGNSSNLHNMFQQAKFFTSQPVQGFSVGHQVVSIGKFAAGTTGQTGVVPGSAARQAWHLHNHGSS